VILELERLAVKRPSTGGVKTKNHLKQKDAKLCFSQGRGERFLARN